MFELNHVCIVARNYHKLAQFYIDALGFFIERNVYSDSSEFLQSIGLTESRVEGVHLRLGDSSITLEIISFAANDDARLSHKKPNDFGIGHICFRMEDIESYLRKLLDKDAQFLSKPTTVNQAGSDQMLKICYLRDPEGNILELREEIKQKLNRTSNIIHGGISED